VLLARQRLWVEEETIYDQRLHRLPATWPPGSYHEWTFSV
jgi:hypothetical protein